MKLPVKVQDWSLILLMAVGASCGLIYEYLVAHYAGRILGSVDTVIYGMIGVMIVAMGIGAFLSRWVACPFTGFAWLEGIIALLGGVAVLVMAMFYAIAFVLPAQLQSAFGLHESIGIEGGPAFVLRNLADSLPYLIGLMLGIFIGMEIPFIARIREHIYQQRLLHNTGTVYGADYIGAGFGAAVWVLVCLQFPVLYSAILTAMVNLILGSIFLALYFPKIAKAPWLLLFNGVIAVVLVTLFFRGELWMNALNNVMYQDKVVWSDQSQYQNIVITQKRLGSKGFVTKLHIDGHLQFSSADEKIYHGMLVQPAYLAANRFEKVLVVGGGDGLAVRDALQMGAQSVDLIDLDGNMVKLFKGEDAEAPEQLSQQLVDLNGNALNNERVNIRIGDAFKVVETLVSEQLWFDAILVDLPDPHHPDLNKLYSDYFYQRLQDLLVADGALVVQATSPYHSKPAFLSILNTLESVGFQVDPMHANVPSFGEWGWALATKSGAGGQIRIQRNSKETANMALSREFVLSSFYFPGDFFKGKTGVAINRLNSPTAYRYHSKSWLEEDGLFTFE